MLVVYNLTVTRDLVLSVLDFVDSIGFGRGWWDEKKNVFHGWYGRCNAFGENCHYLAVALSPEVGGIIRYEYRGSRYGLRGEIARRIGVEPVPTAIMIPGKRFTLVEASALDSIVWRFFIRGLVRVELRFRGVGTLIGSVVEYRSTAPPSWRLLPWELVVYGEGKDVVAKVPFTEELVELVPLTVRGLVGSGRAHLLRPLPGMEERLYREFKANISYALEERRH